MENKKSTAKHLMSCDYNFVFSDRANKSNFPIETIIENIESFVLLLIREDMYAKMLLTLLNIIQKDESINSGHKEDFKTFFSISKEDLLQGTTFHLKFLGQMLLYTTCSNIENKAGKPFVREITIDYIENIAESNWSELNYIRETQTVEFIPTEESRLWEEIDYLSELRLSLLDCPVKRTVLWHEAVLSHETLMKP